MGLLFILFHPRISKFKQLIEDTPEAKDPLFVRYPCSIYFIQVPP